MDVSQGCLVLLKILNLIQNRVDPNQCHLRAAIEIVLTALALYHGRDSATDDGSRL
jgi:hypothetical protein